MSKVDNINKNKIGMVYPERGTLLGCASQYRSLLGAPQRRLPPPPTPLRLLSRYKMWEFKNRHTNTRNVKLVLLELSGAATFF